MRTQQSPNVTLATTFLFELETECETHDEARRAARKWRERFERLRVEESVVERGSGSYGTARVYVEAELTVRQALRLEAVRAPGLDVAEELLKADPCLSRAYTAAEVRARLTELLEAYDAAREARRAAAGTVTGSITAA